MFWWLNMEAEKEYHFNASQLEAGLASLTELGAGAFSACRALTDIPLPAGLKRIGDYAFNTCWKLKDITIPEGATVGKDAFKKTSITV